MCEAYVAISGPRNLSILSCQGTFHYWSVFLFVLWRGGVLFVCLFVTRGPEWLHRFSYVFLSAVQKKKTTSPGSEGKSEQGERNVSTIIDFFFITFWNSVLIHTCSVGSFPDPPAGNISLHSAVSGFPPIGTVCCSLSVMLWPCATLCQLSVSVAQGHFFPGTEAPAWRMRDEFLFRLSGETL